MAIRTGAAAGIEIVTAAKQTNGMTGVVGSSTDLSAADQQDEATDQFRQVVVPEGIDVNNEGDLMATPTYVARMIGIRPEADWVNGDAALTITSGNNAANDETVTVDGVVYTFKTTISATASGAYQVLIGVDRDATLNNLKAAINLEPDGVGALYGIDTEVHPNFEVLAAASAGVLTATAIKRGTAGNARVDGAIQDDGGSYTPQTVDANNATANDIDLYPVTKATGDRYLFGSYQRFQRFTINVGTIGVGTYTVTWKYWDGSAWQALSGVTDGSNSFKNSGERDVTFDIPADWASAVFSGLGPLFWIAAEVDAGTMTTNPIGTQAWSHGLMEETMTNGSWDGDAAGGEDGWEMRKILATTAGTGDREILDVHEEWEAPPLLDGSTTGTQAADWAVPYIIQDVVTVQGCTFVTKTGLYEFTRELQIGPDDAAADVDDFAWLHFDDGDGIEPSDEGTNQDIEHHDNAIWTIGYPAAGKPVAGSWIFPVDNSDAEILLDREADCRYYWYDSKIRSPSADLVFGRTALTLPSAQRDNINQGANFFSVANDHYLTNGVLQDALIAGVSGTSGVRITSYAILINVVFLNIFKIYELTTGTESYYLKEITWIDVSLLVEIDANKTFVLVDPVNLVYDPSDQLEIRFASVTGSSCLVKVSLTALMVDVAGLAVQNVQTYLHENLTNDNLPSANQQVSDRDGLVESEALLETITATTAGSGNALTVVQTGDFTFKAYLYGKVAQSVPIPDVVRNEITGLVLAKEIQLAMLDDPALTAVTAQAALDAVTGTPTVTFHRTGETDPRPIKVIAFENGDGGTWAVGDVMLGATSGADFEIVEIIGDDADSGWIVGENYDGVTIVDGETFNNQTGGRTLSVDANISGVGSFEANYTVLVDNATNAMTEIYDWIAAKMAEDALDAVFEDLLIWGGKEYAQPIFLGGSGWFTERNVANGEGVWVANRGAGTIAYMTDDAGQTFTPPTTVSLDVQTNYAGAAAIGIRIRIETDPGGVLIAEGVTNGSGLFTASFEFTADTDVKIIARLKGWRDNDTTGTITIDGLNTVLTMSPDGTVDLP